MLSSVQVSFRACSVLSYNLNELNYAQCESSQTTNDEDVADNHFLSDCRLSGQRVRTQSSIFIQLQPLPQQLVWELSWQTACVSSLSRPLLQEGTSNQLPREDAGTSGRKPGEWDQRDDAEVRRVFVHSQNKWSSFSDYLLRWTSVKQRRNPSFWRLINHTDSNYFSSRISTLISKWNYIFFTMTFP